MGGYHNVSSKFGKAEKSLGKLEKANVSTDTSSGKLGKAKISTDKSGVSTKSASNEGTKLSSSKANGNANGTKSATNVSTKSSSNSSGNPEPITPQITDVEPINEGRKEEVPVAENWYRHLPWPLNIIGGKEAKEKKGINTSEEIVVHIKDLDSLGYHNVTNKFGKEEK